MHARERILSGRHRLGECIQNRSAVGKSGAYCSLIEQRPFHTGQKRSPLVRPEPPAVIPLNAQRRLTR